jgi:hypothetical protein
MLRRRAEVKQTQSGAIMKNIRKAVAALSVSLLSGSALVHAEPVAQLHLSSSPGDFIGQGLTYDLTYRPSTDPFSTSAFGNVGGVPTYLTFSFGTVTGSTLTNTWALLQFSTASLGIGIQPGSYENVERAPFASTGHSGLDVSFQNRGCNTLSGTMTINRADFVGTLISYFSVDFVQHCEGGTSFLAGQFTFDSTPAPVPELPTQALLAAGLLVLAITTKNKFSSAKLPVSNSRI